MKPVLETSGEREIVQEMVQECGHMPSGIEAVYSEWLYLRRKWKRAQQVHDGLGLDDWLGEALRGFLEFVRAARLACGEGSILMHDNVIATGRRDRKLRAQQLRARSCLV